MDIYDLEIAALGGGLLPLESYRNKLLLIVNVASNCGFTKQYQGLQELHNKYYQYGLRIIGFPCNQFARQEPGDAEEILQFCESHFAISFPLAEKIKVNGVDAHPLFQILKKEAPGVFGLGVIKWNFTKFLVSPGAASIVRFSPGTAPKELEGVILEKLVA